jgi:drug/metabolite transporter (DMT)-like permease
MSSQRAVRTVTVGTILTAVSALGFSTLPIFAVSAYQHGANVTTFLAYRFLLAAVVLWAYVLVTKRGQLPGWRAAVPLLLMGGVGYTAMSLCYVSSVAANRLSPAFAALLLYTYPAIVTVLTWWLDGVALGRRQLAALAVTTAGVALVLAAPGGQAVFTVVGALLALTAAVVYSLYIYIAGKVTGQTAPVVVTTYVATAAALVLLGYGAVTQTLTPLAVPGWLAVAGTALLATVLAVLCFFAGIERLGAARASLVSTLEPVGTAVLSVAFFGDHLAGWQIAGGLLVLVGVGWLTIGRE